MSAGTLVPTLAPVVPPVPVRRFTVDEYHQMIRAGILGEDDDVELLEGWIVPKMPRNPAHDALIAWVHNRVLAPRLREGWYCRGQSAITRGIPVSEHLFAWRTTTTARLTDDAEAMGNDLDPVLCTVGPATAHRRPYAIQLLRRLFPTELSKNNLNV